MENEIIEWIDNARLQAYNDDALCTSSYPWNDAMEGRCLPNPDVYMERDRRMQYDG